MSEPLPSTLPFGERIQQLLDGLQPPRKQAWLSKQSGLSAAVISRLLSGKRSPTLEHAEVMAPVFGLDVATLLRGTDAEARLQEVQNWVPRSHYDDAIKKMIEFESRNRELDEQLKERTDAFTLLEEKRREDTHRSEKLQRELETATTALLLLEKKLERSEERSRRYYEALEEAVKRISQQNTQLHQLAEEAKKGNRSSTTAAVLAGVAAAAGVATVASLIGKEQNDGDDN